jgi:RNA polymerase sigma-70 factor (ECF subfamily)
VIYSEKLSQADGVFIGNGSQSLPWQAGVGGDHCQKTCRRRIVSVQEISDDVVLSRAAQGDSEAFGVLYERYVRRIYNYVYYRTGNTYDAEDLTERVFHRALKHIHNYNNRGLPFSAWLYRIAHNLVANWHRDNSRRKEIPLDDGILGPYQSEHPEHELLIDEEREHLMRIIRHLPADRQQLIILKFVEHLSNAEIGQIMGRTEGAVKSLYHRTLLAIRDDLRGFAFETDRDIITDNGGQKTDAAHRNG